MITLDHIVVLVRSLERSLPWYAVLLDALGFEKTRDHVWWNGSVALDHKQAEEGTRDYERYGPGLNHLGFRAPDRAAFEAVRKAMVAARLEVPEIQTFGDEIATFFKDPDGMRIEVACTA